MQRGLETDDKVVAKRGPPSESQYEFQQATVDALRRSNNDRRSTLIEC